MILSRRLDDKMLRMLKQGKSFFHIGCAGHEAAQVAAGFAMKPGKDWFYPYYRDQALTMSVGMTAREIMLCFLAKADDPNSGGRQMPQHYGHKQHRIVSQSSPTGTQFLQAVGCAMGAVKEKTDEIVYVSSGEGTTSQGDFHEALNWASREKFPVIFFIEDNKYAISVPIWQQTAGNSIFKIGAGYENLNCFEMDGTNFLETYATVKEASQMARSGKGPCLVVADVIRLLPHSSSDDQRKYRKEADLAKDRERDPIEQMSQFLIKNNMMTAAEDKSFRETCHKEVDDAAEWAETQPAPEKITATKFVFSEEPDELEYEKSKPSGNPIVLVDAINHAMAEEMERNPKMIMFGEDIQDDKGGVFTATKGLSKKFGNDRVFNSPLAESSIVGTAIGLATRGWKPVVEIQFGDYVWTAMMQIRNELATMRYRSNNNWACPLVIRIPIGGYIHGALCHSQNIESFFAHIPGLKIALPSNAADAKGLLKTAIRCDDPVLFLEHKGLYRQGFAQSPEPNADYLLPFGKASVKREGENVTIVTYGMMVSKSINAAKVAEEKHGIKTEVIDLRTIVPLDVVTIITSIKKTGKCLVVHEDCEFGGFGGEIVAQIMQQGFEYLDGPVRRVAAKDSPIPYNWFLEEVILPQDQNIVHAIEELSKY
ncbi:dehydrogenase E1 component subunit alpha/beta [bacterium]|nr:dehydrogenase E1 component subunit alpha/beta [bacterium]